MEERLIALLQIEEDNTYLKTVASHLLDYATEYVLSFTGREELIKRLEVVVIEMSRQFYIEEILPKVKQLKQGEVSVTYNVEGLANKLNAHKVILRYHTI